MPSERQIRANRANAARSTGPRTRDGKRVARLNALQHGLAASLQLDPDADPEVRLLQRAIAGGREEPQLVALAGSIAQIETLLRRIQGARRMLPESLVGSGGRADAPALIGASFAKERRDPNEKILERYERRALSRRNSAVLDFDLVRAALEATRLSDTRK